MAPSKLSQLGSAPRAHQKGYVTAGLQQPPAEIPADRASTGHENPHLTLRAKKLDIAFETRMAAAIGLAEFRRRSLFEDGA